MSDEHRDFAAEDLARLTAASKNLRALTIEGTTASRGPLVMLTKRDWSTESRGKRDILRCLVGRHRALTMAIDDGVVVSRCSCGAFRFGVNLWMGGEPFGRRRGWLDRAIQQAMDQAERDIRANWTRRWDELGSS